MEVLFGKALGVAECMRVFRKVCIRSIHPSGCLLDFSLWSRVAGLSGALFAAQPYGSSRSLNSLLQYACSSSCILWNQQNRFGGREPQHR